MASVLYNRSLVLTVELYYSWGKTANRAWR